jgi:uncharacterized membrane protein YoaK (UPF0700 family)
LAQKHRLGLFEVALLVVGAAIAVAIARPAEAFVIRFSTIPISVALGLLAAIAMFTLRKYRKDIYGAIEVIVAFFTLAIAGDTVTRSDVEAAMIGFLGAVYVLVRGMTHFLEGRKERLTA